MYQSVYFDSVERKIWNKLQNLPCVKLVLQVGAKKDCLSENKYVRKCRQCATLKARFFCQRF
jgi:hypothetical protein